MKNLFLILNSIFLLINCKSDDDTKVGAILENKMMFRNKETTWENQCYYKDFEVNEISFNLQGTNYYDEIKFEFSGIEISELSGTYSFLGDINNAQYDPQSNFHQAIINHRLSNGEDSQEFLITGGTVEVEIIGENIKINFDLETAAGPATGHFEGDFIENN